MKNGTKRNKIREVDIAEKLGVSDRYLRSMKKDPVKKAEVNRARAELEALFQETKKEEHVIEVVAKEVAINKKEVVAQNKDLEEAKDFLSDNFKDLPMPSDDDLEKQLKISLAIELRRSNPTPAQAVKLRTLLEYVSKMAENED